MFITHFTLYQFMTIFWVINFKHISSDSRSSNFQNFSGEHAPRPPRKLAFAALGIVPPNLILTPRSLILSICVSAK